MWKNAILKQGWFLIDFLSYISYIGFSDQIAEKWYFLDRTHYKDKNKYCQEVIEPVLYKYKEIFFRSEKDIITYSRERDSGRVPFYIS